MKLKPEWFEEHKHPKGLNVPEKKLKDLTLMPTIAMVATRGKDDPKDMYEYLKSQPGQAFKAKMQQLQGSAAKLRTTQESRTYVPRQRNDLTITDVHSTASKPFEELFADFNKTKITKQGGKLRK